ncbi:MAG: ATP phosphoribosyltransferase [Clostridia bacterium]|nr:ATP phosphoribosyltransferase [Clostridia bacterium]
MIIDDSVLQTAEKITLSLRQLFLNNGYKPYRMSKFEEYDFYVGNKDFLVSDQVITFTDVDGKLMALKPDVTLSIIKNSPDMPNKTQKVFYNENVYRVSKGTGSYKEILQTGIECFGKVSAKEICEVISLAAQSLKTLSEDAVLAISDLGIISSVIEKLALNAEQTKNIYIAIKEKNLSFVDRICENCTDQVALQQLKQLLQLNGTVGTVLTELKTIFADSFSEPVTAFCETLKYFENTDYAGMIRIDFSVVGDINYYNGIIFKGFLRDIPVEVLSGGQYDLLMKKMGRQSSAIGFAVSNDTLDRLHLGEENAAEKDTFVNVALPKGRLGEKIYRLFAEAGYECPALLEPGRKLIFENTEKKVRYFWVKPSDVAIYVERGAADIGVAGKDILLEYQPDVYELVDLKKGKCRMAVAASKSFTDNGQGVLRVATKFSAIAKSFYHAKGRDIDIIHLNGSIEIAPILGLSDVIVDIVETGITLKENDLEVKETVVPISARLIANKSSYKFKSRQIEAIAGKLAEITEEQE